MPDILQDLPIRAPVDRVFDAVSTSDGLNRWWSETCAGSREQGNAYALGFGVEYQWRATITACDVPRLFELTMTHADADWTGSRVRFEVMPRDDGAELRFSHLGWPEANAHYRVSSHCWALYLRLLRRFLEAGETVPYPARLDA